LALPFSARGLQMVSRWSAKGIQAGRSIQRGQFAHDNPVNIGRQFRGAPASEKGFVNDLLKNRNSSQLCFRF